MAMVNTLLKYLKSYFKVFDDENFKMPKEITDTLDNYCLYCVIWVN